MQKYREFPGESCVIFVKFLSLLGGKLQWSGNDF